MTVRITDAKHLKDIYELMAASARRLAEDS